MELKINNLTKNFKDKTAVDNVNLTLTPGVWGLLGENGAGKTTLIKMIAGIMTPTIGEVCFDNKNIFTMGKDYRDIFGFLTQDFNVSKEFTIKDYLEYVSALKGLSTPDAKKQIDELLEVLTLSDVQRMDVSEWQ